MKRCLLDSSFVIDLLNETAAARLGPATRWLQRNPRAELWISPITYAEVMEGAEHPARVRERLYRYRWQTIGYAQAERAAARQRRARQRSGENDAWQIAIAEAAGAIIVGHDRRAFHALGSRYEDHRAS